MPRGAAYDERFARLEAEGADVHGEAAFVERLVRAGGSELGGCAVLDAGCGTGRVAIELARRGARTTGVDLDAAMLDAATRKAPELDWRRSDLATLDVGTERFDVVVMAGNVMIFVAPGTEADVVGRLAGLLVPGGALVAGFQLRAGSYDTDRYDADCAAAGLALEARYATWDGDPLGPSPDYAISVHRAVG